MQHTRSIPTGVKGAQGATGARKAAQATKLAVIALAVLALSGCIEVTQHVSQDGETVHNYVRLTLGKQVLSMADSFGSSGGQSGNGSGSGGPSPDQVCKQQFSPENPQIAQMVPTWVDGSFENLSNEYDCGIEGRFTAARSRLAQAAGSDEKPAFAPVFGDDTVTINLPAEGGQMAPGGQSGNGSGDGQSGGSGQSGPMAQAGSALLASSHYNLLISTSAVDTVRSAEFILADGSSQPLPVTSLSGLYQIQFPIVLWLEADGPSRIVIHTGGA
jgi:hypothetical protein